MCFICIRKLASFVALFSHSLKVLGSGSSMDSGASLCGYPLTSGTLYGGLSWYVSSAVQGVPSSSPLLFLYPAGRQEMVDSCLILKVSSC